MKYVRCRSLTCYNFLKVWQKESGVPILLNTSFNDREPIVETPENSMITFKILYIILNTLLNNIVYYVDAHNKKWIKCFYFRQIRKKVE